MYINKTYLEGGGYQCCVKYEVIVYFVSKHYFLCIYYVYVFVLCVCLFLSVCVSVCLSISCAGRYVRVSSEAAGLGLSYFKSADAAASSASLPQGSADLLGPGYGAALEPTGDAVM